jgi:hypothetical protein
MGKLVIVIGSALALAGACGKGKDAGGGGGGGAGTRPGKLTAQEHKSSDGTLTVKGQLPAAWKPAPAPGGGIKLVQEGEGGSNEGHLQLSIAYPIDGKSPEETIKDTTTVIETYGKDGLVVPPTEIAPGRWGRVSQTVGMQWKPGIDMFDAHALWQLEDKRHVRCWVRWLSSSPQGALDLCKTLEVTAAAPSP